MFHHDVSFARVCLGVLGLSLSACKTASTPPPPANPQAPVSWQALNDERLRGVSGFSSRSANELWAVTERTRQLAVFSRHGGTPKLLRLLPVHGVPEGYDLEALSFLDGDILVLGTEQNKSRSQDAVLIARLTDKNVIVLGQLSVDYQAWKTLADDNHGLEGACNSGNTLYVVSEIVLEEGGQRFAPLAAYDLDQGNWSAHRISLLSDTGRLSGLVCHATANGTRFYAIERHFGVSYIVQFDLPENQSKTTLQPTITLDVTDYLKDNTPNFEGLALSDGKLLVISDNDYGGISGPTMLLEVPLPSDPTN